MKNNKFNKLFLITFLGQEQENSDDCNTHHINYEENLYQKMEFLHLTGVQNNYEETLCQ